MPIFIPDLFSGYVEGRRKAIQDNWTDLTNYNSVLGGQLQNAYDMQTFGDNAQISHNNALTSNQRTALGGMVTDQALARMAKENNLGLPEQQAIANLLQALGLQSEYKFNTRVYNDPNYYVKYTTGAGTGTDNGLTEPMAPTSAGGSNNGTTPTSAGPKALEETGPVIKPKLNLPTYYSELTPINKQRVGSLLYGNLTQEQFDKAVEDIYNAQKRPAQTVVPPQPQK